MNNTPRLLGYRNAANERRLRKNKAAWLLLFVVCCFNVSFAQEHKGHNRIYTSFAWQNFRDQRSVLYDATPPHNHVDPQNPNGYYWSLQYERITKHGLTLGVEFRNGLRNYRMNVTQYLADFDPLAKQNLKNEILQTPLLQFRIRYNTPALLIGYRRHFKPHWSLSAKVGLAVRIFQESALSDEITADHIVYKNDNNIKRILANATMVYMQYGRRDSSKDKFGLKGALPYYEVYLGVDRQFDLIALKSLSLGIEATRSFQGWKREPAVVVLSSPTIDQPRASRDVFVDRNISIGVRISLGLWK